MDEFELLFFIEEVVLMVVGIYRDDVLQGENFVILFYKFLRLVVMLFIFFLVVELFYQFVDGKFVGKQNLISQIYLFYEKIVRNLVVLKIVVIKLQFKFK